MSAEAVSLVTSPAWELLYHYCRCQRPQLTLSRQAFRTHGERMFLRAAHSTTDMTAERFLSGLHVLDAALAMGCLERLPAAWELLFAARAGRSDRLLIDALRWHAVRFFPQNQAAQEEQVTDFWGSLLAPDREEGIPLLEKYDGQRPLVPWLIHCFRNAVITWKRKQKHLDPLPDLDVRDAHSETDADSRWSQTFADAARDWLAHLKEEELALLGLRWRYRLSQREVAKVFGIHEGNIAKRIDKLRARCLEQIGRDMEANGFLGEDLQGFILREMDSLLLEEPQLTAESLARLLRKLGMSLPIGEGSA